MGGHGASLVKLVRRAVAAVYRGGRTPSSGGFDRSFGAWKDRGFDGLEYVARIRGRGLGNKLEQLDR